VSYRCTWPGEKGREEVGREVNVMPCAGREVFVGVSDHGHLLAD
jgi:hypothetical protein